MATNPGKSTWTSPQFGYASLAAQGIAAGITAIGAFESAKHSNAVAKANANIARINAQMLERQAQATLRAAERQVIKDTLQAGMHKSKQVASMASSGFAVNDASNVELLTSTDLVKETERNETMADATRKAWGFRTQAANANAQASVLASNKTNPWEAFGTSLLQGAGQVANSYLVMSAKGVFDENANKAKPAPLSRFNMV